MSNKVLAVHLTPRRLATAAAESTIGTFRVTSITDGEPGSDDDIARKLASGNWDRVVATLPADKALFRFLNLPFHERRRIALAVGPALEEHVPLSLDEADVAWDFAADTGAGKPSVLAAMAPSTEVLAAIDRLARAGRAPSKLIWAPTATAEVYRRAVNDGLGFAAVDVGPDGAVIAVFSSEGLFDLRIVGHSEAEAMVRNVAFTLRTLALPSPRIVIGGPFGRRIAKPLAAALPDHAIEQLPAECPFDGIDDPAWRDATPAIGLLFAATGEMGRPVIDFSPAAGAWAGPMLERLRPLAPWALASSILALTAGGIDYARLSGHRAELERRALTVFRASMPGVSGDKARRLKMEMRLREVLGQREGADQGPGADSPLAVLSAISAAVPEDVSVEFDTFQHAAPNVRLTGKGDSFEAVTRLEEALGGSGRFAAVAVKDVHAAVNGTGVDFQLELKLQAGSPS